MKRPTLLIGSFALALLGSIAASSAAPQKPGLKDFMQVKLQMSQSALQGLVMEDYDMIVKHAEAMSLLSFEETWQVYTTSDYIEQSRKFRAACDALVSAAKKKNLDKSAEAYNTVTNSCVECHKYVRTIRIAEAKK